MTAQTVVHALYTLASAMLLTASIIGWVYAK